MIRSAETQFWLQPSHSGVARVRSVRLSSMDCTGHKLVERMPSATSDSKHRVANLQRGGIDWISFPFPSLMDKCYQPSAQHPSGAWNSAAAKQRSHRFVTGSRLCGWHPVPCHRAGGANMLPEPGAFSITYRLKLPRRRLERSRGTADACACRRRAVWRELI